MEIRTGSGRRGNEPWATASSTHLGQKAIRVSWFISLGLEGFPCTPPTDKGALCPYSAAGCVDSPVTSLRAATVQPQGKFLFWNITTCDLKFSVSHQSQPRGCSCALPCCIGRCAGGKEGPRLAGTRNVSLLILSCWHRSHFGLFGFWKETQSPVYSVCDDQHHTVVPEFFQLLDSWFCSPSYLLVKLLFRR